MKLLTLGKRSLPPLKCCTSRQEGCSSCIKKKLTVSSCCSYRVENMLIQTLPLVRLCLDYYSALFIPSKYYLHEEWGKALTLLPSLFLWSYSFRHRLIHFLVCIFCGMLPLFQSTTKPESICIFSQGFGQISPFTVYFGATPVSLTCLEENYCPYLSHQVQHSWSHKHPQSCHFLSSFPSLSH